MAETSTESNQVPDSSSINKDNEFNTDRSDQNVDSTSIPNDTSQSSKTSIQTEANNFVPNPSSDNVNYDMSTLSIHGNRFQSDFNTSYYSQPVAPFHPTIYQPDTQAQLVAFTPPLMSIRLPYGENQTRSRNNYRQTRSYTPRQQTSIPSKNKPEIHTPAPKFYVDTFSSNFADKPASSESNNDNKTKTKHVTFQEPETANNSFKVESDYSSTLSTSSLSPNAVPYQSSYWRPPVTNYQHEAQSYGYGYPNNHYSYNEFYPSYPQTMIDPRFSPRSRGMNMMSGPFAWPTPSSYYDNRRMPYAQNSFRPRQLYDPNQPKGPSITESQPSSQVLRPIVPKNKKKIKQTSSDDSSTVSTPEPITHPITILRKPTIDSETTPSKEEVEEQATIPLPNEESTTIETASEPLPAVTSSDIPSEVEQTIIPSESDSTLSFPSHELLSILQSANCISSLNEYAQQKKFLLNFEYSSTSPTSFTCSMSINQRHFPPSSSCSTKTEAQKIACDQAVRTLYRESCSSEGSSLEFSSKHDYIAHRSISTFQNLNVNELLLGRKTLACMLMITDEQYSQAQVVSIGTGNSCLDETNLSYADNGTALHDCHAEILARRGLIKYLFQQIKQCQEENPSIFISDSTPNKYQLRENITFHLYISSLPCGNASLNISSNALRYKQGAIEGTSSTPMNYPIKSCSDKIYRWNILGIQGGLLINLLTQPIYLQSITIACETTFDRQRVNYSLAEHSKEHFHSLPSPYRFHIPDINCPTMKSFQKERQVAKLQSNAFAWNITEVERMELLEPMTGRLKNNRSMSSLSKQNFLRDFLEIFREENSLTYQRAKQLDQNYLLVKNLISTAFENESSEGNSSWISKSDRLEQFQLNNG